MNRAQKVLRSLEEVFEKRARVHPDHVAELDRRLKEKKIPHHKYAQPAVFGGIPYGVYGIRPEAWQPFMSCCADCQHCSSSPNPVTITGAQTGGGAGEFAGGGEAGGYSGAGGSSVAET